MTLVLSKDLFEVAYTQVDVIRMITLFRTKSCPGCSAIQETLEELCIAHKVVLIDEDPRGSSGLPAGTRPPVLVDEDEVVQGSDAIIAHLEKLKDFKATWEKFQSDACYCDEAGDIE
jgi:glutaredoxin